MPKILVIRGDEVSQCDAGPDGLPPDDDLLEDAVQGDVILVRREEGCVEFETLDTTTGQWGKVDEC